MNHKLHYDKLIKKRKLLLLDKNMCYCERHHILPKCMGGVDNKENFIYLTAKGHFVAHLLLVKMYPKNKKLIFALHRMCHGKKDVNYGVSGRRYEWVRIEAAKNTSELLRGKHPSEEILKKHRKPKSDSYKKTMKETWNRKYREGYVHPFLGRNLTNEHKYKLSKSHTGLLASEETKQRMSVSQRNRVKAKCCHCGKLVDPGNYGKLHGDKCKNKKENTNNESRLERIG